MAVLAVLVSAAPVAAQTKPPTPLAGSAGVKQQLQSLHYKEVHGLRRGPDGQWTGKATRNGVEKQVTVSPNGSVIGR
jgi:hypothetical protein